jgi:hypothetical protein
MVREVRMFNQDFDCQRGGGKVVVSGNVIPQPAAEDGDGAHRVKITYCTGIAQCGIALPKVACRHDCAVVDNLFACA